MRSVDWSFRYSSYSELGGMLASPMLDDVLGQREQRVFARLNHRHRRTSWLGGRMTSKRLIHDALRGQSADMVNVRLSDIEICSGSGRAKSQRPLVTVRGMKSPWSLSISHSHQGVLAGLCRTHNAEIGVDLVSPESYSEGFMKSWFTNSEQAWLARSKSPLNTCRVWAVKEAVYKACNTGEGFAPRRIEVEPNGQFHYCGMDFDGSSLIKTKQVDGQLAVVVIVDNHSSLTMDE